jgi:methyl-accepting chemotaxis protein
MAIRTRAIAAFGALLVLFGALGTLSYMQLSKLNFNVLDLSENWMPSTEALTKLEYINTRARVTLSARVMFAKNQEELDKSLARRADYLNKYDELAKRYQTTMISGPEEKALWDTVVAELEPYNAMVNKVIEAKKRGDTQLASDLLIESSTQFDRYLVALDKSIEFNRDGAQHAKNLAGDTTSTGKTIIVAATLFALAIGIASLLMVIRTISQPIQTLTAAMSRLANGDLDVIVPDTQRKDEIGQMAQTVLVFKDNALAKLKSDEAQERARQEQERMKAQIEEQEKADREAQAQRAKAVDNLIATLERESAAVFGELDSAALQMGNVAQDLSSIVARTSEISSVVASASHEASSSVQTVASATEEMSSSIQEISRQVAESTTVTQLAVNDSNKATGQVGELAKAAEKIGEIVKVISDVAAKTDLLALNATIEAARAGEAGKGFAVVASEVKQLASQTAKATGDIESQIGAIQNATRQTVVTIQAVSETINRVNSTVSSIAAAVEEQSAATNEISRNTQQANTGTQEVSRQIEQVATMAEQSGNAASQVGASAGQLTKQATRLKESLSTFISSVRRV